MCSHRVQTASIKGSDRAASLVMAPDQSYRVRDSNPHALADSAF